jgi:ribosomal-protein-alanine N-acetyltransferase
MLYDDKDKTITTHRLKLRLFQNNDAITVAKLCNNSSLSLIFSNKF